MFFKNNPLVVITAKEKGALDLAGRIGLEADQLVFPVVATGNLNALPVERKVLIIGSSNRLVPPSLKLPDLKPGTGALVALPQERGVLIWGNDERGQNAACIWAASLWDGLVPDRPLVVSDRDLIPPQDAVYPGLGAENNKFPSQPPLKWQCLSQAYTVEGLLGSSDASFPDRTRLDFRLDPALSLEEFALTCDFAARIGLESTGLIFPLSGNKGTIVEIGGSGQSGWIELGEKGLSLPGGEALADNLKYLARTFPELPGDPPWLSWDLQAAADWLGCPDNGSAEDADLLYEASWEDAREAERFREAWRNQVLPALEATAQPGSDLQVEITISETDAERNRLAGEIKKSLSSSGFKNSVVTIRPAYKQGFHWLTGEVLPRLQDLEPDAVRLSWRPFLKEQARDMPLRWLQETYPADEIYFKKLGLHLEFEKAAADQDAALILRAFKDGQVIYQAGFDPAAALRPYLDGYEEAGLACHPAGWIKVSGKDGKVLYSSKFETDLERFWNWYSREVLSDIEKRVGHKEPLFGTLSIEYYGSEPERGLGVRQEVDSPLEALHQDLYFTTLDRFAALGSKRRDEPYEAPGAILPWIYNEPGCAPRARISLSRPVPRKSTAVKISAYNPQAQLLKAGSVFYRWTPPALAPEAERSAAKESFTEDATTLTGVEKRLSRLKSEDPALKCRVFVASRTVEGRPVYGLALYSCPAGITSPARAALLRPTVLFNARHHGNEVSSTPAVLSLLESLTRRGELLKYFNLVAVPFENADGAHIHYKMAKTNPRWKLHAARYNRDGAEFYQEYFKADSVYSESKALRRLWRAWLPDLVLDAHGIPSHEWIQYFSGYNSPPRFAVSYWLPNALFYGILNETDAFGNTAAGLDLAEFMVKRINKDGPISSANRDWLNCYKKYGHRFMPEKFPLEQLGDMIFYRRRDENKFTFAANYPHVTAVHCVTEVADETATGDYLKLCVRAHRKSQQAALFWLARLSRREEYRLEYLEDGLCWRRRSRIRCQQEKAGL